ncbi:hypothetical protein [Sulfuriflexus mobilis]|uniref:hypothetical protein n=1 Tax=Sulfuriflexus mobilis TaxID=1811807 RepID=UPI000F82327C|nr:hypothetical protein [Sulfuriflexus mobilis]
MRILFSIIAGVVFAYFFWMISVRIEIWLLEPQIPNISIFVMTPIGFVAGAIIGYRVFGEKK